MAGVFLYSPTDFRNLCAISRTLEVLGLRECFVFDSYRLVRERYGKSRTRELRDISGGAFEKIRWQQVTEPTSFLQSYEGRTVATVAGAEARPLTEFRFRPTDLLVFGSESQGLPAEVVASCTAPITIPARGETRSLNLAVAFGIALFECQRQLWSTSTTV